MLTRRQMHGAAVLGDYLYVFSGIQGDDLPTASVQKARIRADGQLDAWTETTPLPANRTYIGNSTLVLNDIVYIIGGDVEHTAQCHTTAIWSRPGPDGNLEPWSESPPFGTKGITCMPVVSTQGFLHVIGGYTEAKQPTHVVISGVLDADGRIIGWEMGPSLPIPLWFHNAAVLGGQAWVWGGLGGPKRESASDRVFHAPVLSTGRLGAWEEDTSFMPAAYYSAAMGTAGPFLMSFCPRQPSSDPTTDVWFAPVTPKGLGGWNRVTTDIPAKLYISVAADYRRGRVYIPGGRMNSGEGDENVDNRVYFIELSPSMRRAAESRWTAATPAAPPAAAGPAGSTPVPAATSAAVEEAAAQGGGGASAGLTYLAQAQLSKDAVDGFMPFGLARQVAVGPPSKPMLLYFNLETVRACQDQKNLLSDAQFKPLVTQAAFAWVSVKEWPQLAQQVGIYRVPTWVIYDSRGYERGRFSGVLTPAQLAAGIAAYR